MNNCYTATNGRVNITDSNISTLFSLYDKNKVNTPVTYRDAFIYNTEPDLLTKKFFSQDNINLIQSQIIEGVYKISNNQYKIGSQSQETLIMIMREIYENGPQNTYVNVSEQEKIISLNKLVLNYCIPRIYNSVQSYYLYIKDASTLATPLDLPKNFDNRNKTLKMNAPWIN